MSKFYCVECGHQVEEDAKKCTNCHKNPSPKDHAFKDYVLEKIEGEAEDGALKLAVKFIKKYLYGTLMSCSLVFAGVALVANNPFAGSHIVEVNERPIVMMTYTGEGLDNFEIVERYVEAIKDGDSNTYRGLMLEYVLPEVYDSIKDMESLDDANAWPRRPFMSHTLLDYGKYYFREGNYTPDGSGQNYTIQEETAAFSKGKYGDYNFYRHNIIFLYYSYNRQADYPSFSIVDQIEVLEVDGKNYIVGEEHHFENNNMSDQVLRGVLFEAGGDTSNLDFDAELYKSEYDDLDSQEKLDARFPEH